jgi:hypothetical protein
VAPERFTDYTRFVLMNTPSSAPELARLASLVARSIEERGLRVACLWLFESHLPLRGVLHASLVAAAPMVGMLLGSRAVWRDLSVLLESGEGTEALLNALETREVKPCEKKR